MTEEDFYRKKIFEKNSILKLRIEYPFFKDSLSIWYKSARFNEIQEVKTFLMNKLKQMEEDKENLSFNEEELYQLCDWWMKTPKVCHYCALPEESLDTLRMQPNHINKRYPKRGKSLEIDRKQSNLPYTNIDNLVIACYWCNNAKTDTFNHDEFMQIGLVIKKSGGKGLI